MEVRLLPPELLRPEDGDVSGRLATRRVRKYKGAAPNGLGKELVPKTVSSPSLAAVVLAAGKGKRLKSATQKVLHPIAGRPARWWVLRNVAAARPSRIVIV
ncbi:MAG: NTP transferase domain-containing protein, partial [Actinomycetota bacterium]